MEIVGLIIYATLFVVMGVKHLTNHNTMAGYAASEMGSLGVLGGAPTGVLLVVAGVGAVFSQVWAFYALAVFLAIAIALFHRNFLTDPGGFKTVALLGATLALAALV